MEQRSALGLQAVGRPAGSGEHQQFVVRRVGWRDDKVLSELETARRFCRTVRDELVDIQSAPSQYSDVDVTAKSRNGSVSEDFQVTRLWDASFWQQVNVSGSGDIRFDPKEFLKLVRAAVKRKSKFSDERRKKIILLIDVEPAQILPPSASVIADLKPELDQIGFKQVWLVGPDQSFHLT